MRINDLIQKDLPTGFSVFTDECNTPHVGSQPQPFSTFQGINFSFFSLPGKENKETKEKATKKDDKPTTTTKKPALGKSKSHSAVSNVVLDDAIPSTSKQKKAVPAKRAKTAK